MDIATFEDPPGFSRLTKTEQIDYLQQLWDRIAAHPADVPIPDSHLALAERRLVEHRSHPTAARDAGEIILRLSGKKR